MEKRVAHLRECACGVGLHRGVGWTRLFGTHPVGVVVVVVRARPLSVVRVFREEHVKVALVQGEGLDGELRAARRLGILVLDKGDATVVPVDANPSAQEPGEGRSLVTAALRDIEESGGFLRTHPAQRRGKTPRGRRGGSARQSRPRKECATPAHRSSSKRLAGPRRAEARRRPGAPSQPRGCAQATCKTVSL